MRFSKGLLIAALVVTPWVASADQPSDSDITSQAGSSSDTTSGIDFNPFNNFIGDPGNPQSLTSGDVRQLTFLAGGDDPVSITVNIINLSLSFLGLLSLIFILYAGLKWFTARDNEDEATKAKEILVGGVVGLVVVLGSVGIAQLLFNTLLTSTTVESASLLDWVIAPAYAEETAPVYKPEELPFDPYTGSYSKNVAVYDGTLTSLYFVDLGTADPVTVTFAIINILLTLLGFGFLVLLLYAGVLWVTARGNEETVTKAKTILIRAVIGLAIILSAYGVANFLLGYFWVNTFSSADSSSDVLLE